MKRVIAIVLLLVTLVSFSACAQKTVDIKVEDIRGICELATLECYYNNVAKIEKEADNILEDDRTMWIEYEGKATIGIEMSELDIDIIGETVHIKMPDAKLLSTDYTLKDNAYIISDDKGLLPNKISVEEQEKGVKEGQEVMKAAIENNKGLLLKAEEKAKEFIENYVIKFGEVAGKEYKIEWTK